MPDVYSVTHGRLFTTSWLSAALVQNFVDSHGLAVRSCKPAWLLVKLGRAQTIERVLESSGVGSTDYDH